MSNFDVGMFYLEHVHTVSCGVLQVFYTGPVVLCVTLLKADA